ncbi:YncE family protein [Clostridium nigeriense]|uniref:YncE family protein n=1 Tax=Clostridium nigeriense TaxID=1805470 RepID=UPI003D34D935
MINTVSKSIFYVSNLGSDKVSVIDGKNWSIIDEIQVGSRPYEIVVDNKNNIYVATDRNDRITIVDHISRTNKSLFIPNNGHIKVDSISQKIYVSNTEEVCIYSLDNSEMINKIGGFIAIDSIELNKDGSKLFVLDIFQNEVRVYDTFSLRLIKVYKDIGENPDSIFIEDKERYLYVSNRGINRMGLSGNVTIVDLTSDNISYIDFPEGSILTSIEGNSRILYVVNVGLNRIDIVDTIKKSVIGMLKHTLDFPQKIKISKDKSLILVTSIDSKGYGALDIIDIEKQRIINTFKFDEKNIKPYDVAIITEDSNREEEFLLNSLNHEFKENREAVILAKKVISSYKEKIIFPQENIEFISERKIEVEEIKFESCKIVEESKNKEFIYDKDNYIILNFEFFIPYYIRCINSKKEKLNIKGKLRGKQKAILYISNNSEIEDLEFTIKSKSELISSPYIKDNIIIFDVSSIISTYVTKEELILLPSREINNKLREVKNEANSIQ